MPQVNLATAFAAGLLSFVSPCVLPLVPAYLSFLTGSSLEDLKGHPVGKARRMRVMGHALAFVLGFTTIFVLLGLSASAVGGVLGAHRDLIARIGGVLIVIFGLHMMGVLRLPFLMMDKRMHLRGNQTYVASFLIGIGFAAGWSPCIGPILSGILLMASQEHQTQRAAADLLAYSLGLAAPFLIVATAVSWALRVLNKTKSLLPKIEFAAGVVMVVAGVVLASDSFLRVSGWFYQFVPVPKL